MDKFILSMNIYFSGIGGSGLFPLALLALDCGIVVSGSDSKVSPNIEALQKIGVYISPDQSGLLHLSRAIDWFIQTSALPSDHPELLLAEQLGIKTSKRDELINYILEMKSLKLIAVSGTHGKTTTTAMLVWLFKQFNIPVSYLIGSTISFGPAAKFESNSQYFILECDEFDRNFLHYKPDIAVIPSLDYDHPDTYPTKKSYLEAFQDFIGLVEMRVFTHTEVINTLNILDPFQLNKLVNDSSSLDINKIKLPGEHNRSNAMLAVSAFCSLGLGFEVEDVIDQVNGFPGTARRFEKIADRVYSDYGHHPTEIAATLELAREVIDSNN